MKKKSGEGLVKELLSKLSIVIGYRLDKPEPLFLVGSLSCQGSQILGVKTQMASCP